MIYWPNKHNTGTLYVHLFTFVRHVPAVLFGSHHAEAQVHNRKRSKISFTQQCNVNFLLLTCFKMYYKLFVLWIYSSFRHGSLLRTWVKVVRCRLLAGVGHDAVVGVWPACWGALGGEGPPLPSSDCGSGFNFLNAPSAPVIAHRTIRSIRKKPHVYISEGFKGTDQRLPVMSSN